MVYEGFKKNGKRLPPKSLAAFSEHCGGQEHKERFLNMDMNYNYKQWCLIYVFVRSISTKLALYGKINRPTVPEN